MHQALILSSHQIHQGQRTAQQGPKQLATLLSTRRYRVRSLFSAAQGLAAFSTLENLSEPNDGALFVYLQGDLDLADPEQPKLRLRDGAVSLVALGKQMTAASRPALLVIDSTWTPSRDATNPARSTPSAAWGHLQKQFGQHLSILAGVRSGFATPDSENPSFVATLTHALQQLHTVKVSADLTDLKDVLVQRPVEAMVHLAASRTGFVVLPAHPSLGETVAMTPTISLDAAPVDPPSVESSPSSSGMRPSLRNIPPKPKRESNSHEAADSDDKLSATNKTGKTGEITSSSEAEATPADEAGNHLGQDGRKSSMPPELPRAPGISQIRRVSEYASHIAANTTTPSADSEPHESSPPIASNPGPSNLGPSNLGPGNLGSSSMGFSDTSSNGALGSDSPSPVHQSITPYQTIDLPGSFPVATTGLTQSGENAATPSKVPDQAADDEQLESEALDSEALDSEALDSEALDSEALDSEALDSAQAVDDCNDSSLDTGIDAYFPAEAAATMGAAELPAPHAPGSSGPASSLDPNGTAPNGTAPNGAAAPNSMADPEDPFGIEGYFPSETGTGAADQPPTESETAAQAAADAERGLLQEATEQMRAGNSVEALAAARRCLERFPQSAEARDLAASWLARAETWQQLAELYEQVLPHQVDNDVRVKIRLSLARLYQDKLGAPERALDALHGACELRAGDADLHLDTARLSDTLGEQELAASHYRAALASELFRADIHHDAAAFFLKMHDRDAAWNAASVLSFVGHSTPQEQALVDSHRVDVLPQLARPLDDSDFALGLNLDSGDPELDALLQFVGQHAQPLVQLAPRKERALLSSLTPTQVVGGTTMLGSSLLWASTLLDVKPPELYLRDDEGTGENALWNVSPLPVENAAWCAGRSLTRGVSPQQLVFVWARSLLMLRPGNQAMAFAGSSEQLLALVNAYYAASDAFKPTTTVRRRLAKALRKRLPEAELSRLQTLVSALPHASLESRLTKWTAAFVRQQNRIGLVACGDPELAARSLERMPAEPAAPIEQQLQDLLRFAVSEQYAQLRRQLGISLNKAAAA